MARKKSTGNVLPIEKHRACRKLLDEALELAIGEHNNIEWILDWASEQDDLSEYGYKTGLEDTIEELEKRLEAYHAELPEIENIVDEMKFEFFVANFKKIPLKSLEWIVKTVDKNKLTV